MNPVSTPPCTENSQHFSDRADFEEKPFFYCIKSLFPEEPEGNFSHLTEIEHEALISWWGHEVNFKNYVGKKAVKCFSSLTPDYIRQQFDRILTDKEIEVEKIDSHERICAVVFDVFWQLAKEENAFYLSDEELKKDISSELKIPANSTIINTIVVKFSHEIQHEACLGISNWCLCNIINIVRQFFQQKVDIKLNLSIDDIMLKEMLLTNWRS